MSPLTIQGPGEAVAFSLCVIVCGLAVLMMAVTAMKGGMWRCQKLGWHPGRLRQYSGFDGCSFHARCGRCGFVGLEDSQGNLF